jgi:putative transposase
MVERTIVVGDLSQRQMVTKQHVDRNKHLNRAIYNEWGLYTFTQMLSYKCDLYGKELVFLDERNTSKMCSGCGNLQAMPLWKRTYCCVECGLVMDRDENSAHNILTRFLAGQPPYTQAIECDVLQDACLDVVDTGSTQTSKVQQLGLW